MTQTKVGKDLEAIILCALRYAIPRTTYMPEAVAQYIEDHWDKLSSLLQNKIHEDIRNFYGQSFADNPPWDRIISLKIDDKNSLSL